MQVIGSFNGFFKKNKNAEEKVNDILGNNSYKIYTESVDDIISNYNKGIRLDFFETSDLKNAQKIKNILSDAKMLRHAMLNGEKVISYDMETLGSLSSSNDAFAVTEFAANIKDYSNNSIENLIDLNMGVSESVAKRLIDDVNKGFDGKMTESAKVTIERLPFISASNVEVNRVNVNKAIKGLMNKDLRYGDNTHLANKLLSESYKMKDLKDNITIGYNIDNFDNIVRKKLLESHGLETDLFSTNKQIDIQKIFMTAFDTEIHDMYEKKGMGSVKGKFRVENLAKLFGVDAGTSHVASDDTLTVFNILEANFDGGEETVLDRAINNIEKKINNSNFTTNNGNKNIVYRAITSKNTLENYSFNKSDNTGGALANNDLKKQLDFMVNNYNEEPMLYRDRSSVRGMFYEAGDMRVIPREYLNEQTLKAIGDDAQEAYVLPLKSLGNSNFGHTSYIIRGSKDELEDVLSSNFSTYNLVEKVSEGDGSRVITKEAVNMQESIYFNDIARRNFDAMFDISSNKDFNYVKNMYGAFNELNDAYKELGGNDILSISQIEDLVSNGFINVNDKKLTLFDNASSLRKYLPDTSNKGKYVKGDLVAEWVRDFNTMYGALRDTNDIATPIIKNIESNVNFSNVQIQKLLNGTPKDKVGQVLSRAKKNIFVSSYNDIFNSVLDIAGENSINNEYVNTFDISRYNYADIFVDGKYSSINIFSVDDAIDGLGKKVYRNTYTAKNEVSKKNIAISNLLEISRDLESRKIIDEDLLSQIKTSGDPNSAIKKVANEIFNYGKKARGDMPEELLIKKYLENMFNESSEQFKMLENLRQGLPTLKHLKSFEVNDIAYNEFVNNNLDQIKDILGVQDIFNDVIEKNIHNETLGFNFSTNNKMLSMYSSINTIDGKIKMLPKQFLNYLKLNMNYQDKEIAAVADMLFHSYDMERMADKYDFPNIKFSKEGDFGNGYLTRGYGVSFVKGNNKGDISHGFLIYNPENAEEVIKAYARGEISNKAAYQPLPTPIERYGKRYLKQGNSSKMITEQLSVYSSEPIVSSHFIGLKETNTITEILNSQRIIKSKFDEAMEIGDTENASRLLNNQYNKIISNEIGTSTYRRINGKKQFVPNMNDLMDYKKPNGLLGLLPSLYYEDKEIRNELNSLFGRDDVENEFYKIQSAIDDYNMNNFQMRSDIHEWYINNVFYNKNLAERMIKLDNLSSGSAELIERAVKEAREGSMLVKDSMAGKYNLIYSKERFVVYDAFSEYDSPLRPLHNQRLAMKPIVYDEFIKNASNRGINDINEFLNNKRIYLGGLTRSNKANLNFNTIGEVIETPIYEGISAKVAQMPSAVYYEKVNSLNPTELMNNFIKTNEAITMEDVEYILRSYQNAAATNEQHSILRPSIAKYVAPEKDIFSIKLNGVGADEFKVGDIVDNNTITGRLIIDGKTVEVKNKKIGGRVVDVNYDSNIIQIEPLNKPFNEIKFNMGGEKTVSTPILGKNEKQYKFSEFLFDNVFGEDVALVGHMEFGKHKNAGLILQNKFDSVIEMLNLYGTNKDFNLFERAIKQSGLDWNLTFTKDKRTGLKYAIKNTSKVNGNAYTMLNNALDIFSKKSTNETLVARINKELLDNEERGVYRTTLKFAELNESLQAAENELGRKIKDTPRKRQVTGSNPLPGFRTIDEFGEMQKVIQPIIDMNIENIQNTNAFKKAYTDIGNIYNTSKLITYGEEAGVNVLVKDLLDIDVNNKSLTVDMLYNSVYGLDADKYSVLKLNLKNQVIRNPVSGKKEKFAYIPIVHTNIMDDNQIYVSKTQTVVSDFLRKLSLRENLSSLEGTKYENYELLESEISNAYRNVYNALPYEYSSKSGLMNEMIMSGRVELSGMSLTSGVIPNEFLDERKTKMTSKLGNSAIKIVDGKPVYEDIIWTSMDFLESMGFDSETVGKNLYKSNFAANKQFLEIAKIHNLVDSNGKIIHEDGVFSKLGNVYAREIGIEALATREPNFHPGSTRAAKIKVDDTLSGYVTVLPPWMAGPHNADVDGDNEFIQLIGLEKTNEGVVLRGEDDKIMKSINSLFDLQKELNEEYVNSHENMINIVRNSSGEFTGEFNYISSKDNLNYTLSENKMMEIINKEFDMNGNMNFFSDKYKEKFERLGLKVRQNKLGIGYISNVNYKIREMAFAGIDRDIVDIEKYNRVIDFTTQTEQKIIDVKHSNIEKLTTSSKYEQGIRGMSKSKSNLDENFSMVVDAVKESGMYSDFEISNYIDIINDDYIDNTANRNLKAIYDIFKDDDLVSVYNEQAFKSIPNVKAVRVEDTKKLIDSISENDDIETITSKVVKNNNELILKASRGNNVVINDFIGTLGDVIEEKDGDSFYKITNIDNLKETAEIINLSNNEILNIYGTREENLSEIMSKKFSLLFDDDAEDAIKKGFNLSKVNDKIDEFIFDNPEKTMSFLKANELNDKITDINSGSREYIKSYLSNSSVNPIDVENILKGNNKNLFKAFNNKYTDLDVDMLKFSHEELDKFYKNGKINRTQFSEILYNINKNIIEKGKEAKAQREIISEYIQDEVMKTVKLNSSKVSYKDFNNKLSQLKIHNIDEMNKQYLSLLETNTNKILNDFNEPEVARDIIKEWQGYVNETITSAKEFNKNIGNKKTILYAENFDFYNGREKLLNWNKKNKNMLSSLKDNPTRTLDFKEFMSFSKSKIGFGEYADLSLKDLDIDTLKSLSNFVYDGQSENVSKLIKESQENINSYIKYIVNNKNKIPDQFKNTKINITKISKPLEEEFGVEAMNRKLLELAEQRRFDKSNATRETIENISEHIDKTDNALKKLLKNKYFVGAGIVGAGAVALSVLGGSRPIRQGNTYDNSETENKKNRKPVSYEAPPSVTPENRTVMQGLNFKIKGKVNNNLDTKELESKMTSMFRSSVGNEININTTQEDNKEDINDNWISNRISKLLN